MRGDQPDKVLELVPGAVANAQRVLAEQPETRERFERVSQPIEDLRSCPVIKGGGSIP